MTRTMTRPAHATARVYLALSNADMVSVALAKAVADGANADDVCVLLLDTRDPAARQLAVAILQRSSDLDLDAEETRVLRRDEIPTGIAVIPLRGASGLFAQSHPGVAKGIQLQPPAGHVRVVAVGDGGATLLHLPTATAAAVGSA